MIPALLDTDERRLPARRKFDQYFTPRADVERCLQVIEGKPRVILDPAAGTGIWGRVARERWPEAFIRGIEIDPRLVQGGAYDHWLQTDFLSMEWGKNPPEFDLIMGNPPYSENAAERFIRAAVPLLSFGGRLLFLLRLSFLEGYGRSEGLFREYPPAVVYVAGRVNFEGCGSASPYPQAVFSWSQGHRGSTEVRWLPRKRAQNDR